MVIVYTKKQAADLLKISVKTLERKMFDGSLSYCKIGKRILLDQVSLEDFLQKCRHPAKETGGAA